MSRLVRIVAFIVLGAAVGCTEDVDAGLRSRSAFDLDCPVAQVRLVNLTPCSAGDRGCTKGVTGCGRKATYIYDDQRGTWILNGSTDGTQPSASTK